MADAPQAVGINISDACNERAPFIYFDTVTAFGINNGIVQLEVAADTSVPEGNTVRNAVLMTAHLRCNPVAAIALRDAINKALDLLKLPTSEQLLKPS